MNYTDIHTFLTIASSPSLSKAAESLFVSQPALSHRLSALEEELGNRTDHNVKKDHVHWSLPKPDNALSQLHASGSSYGLRREKIKIRNSPRHSFES